METAFKYLGRVLTASADEFLVVVANIWKAQMKWEYLSRILRWEGAEPWNPGTFYKAVVQATLLFGL